MAHRSRGPTPAAIIRARTLYDEGVTYVEIARSLKVSTASLRAWRADQTRRHANLTRR